MSRRRTAAAIAALVCLVGTGCTGQDSDPPVNEGKSPTEVMELAKKTLDDAAGVRIELSSTNLPDGVSGLTAATGVGVHPASFQGKISVIVSGFPAEVDVIGTDGKVWIRFPDWREVDPADYGAPDPAQLMASEGGLSDLLIEAEGLKAGKSVLGGEKNDETLTPYSGTVPAEAVAEVIPSASGDDFDVEFHVTADGELRQVKMTGEFYPDTEDMTYRIEFTDYGTTQDIKAP